MLGDFVIRPTLHGALGPWDEIINMIPVVVGVVLIIYLYINSRRRRAAEDDAPPEEEELPVPQVESKAASMTNRH